MGPFKSGALASEGLGGGERGGERLRAVDVRLGFGDLERERLRGRSERRGGVTSSVVSQKALNIPNGEKCPTSPRSMPISAS